MESERPVLAGARREHPAPRTIGRCRRAGEPAGCTRRLWRAAAFRTEGLTSHNAGHYATCSLPRLSPRHQHSLCRFSIVALNQPLRLSPTLGPARWPCVAGTARDADSQNAPSKTWRSHFFIARVACLNKDSSPRVVGAFACAASDTPHGLRCVPSPRPGELADAHRGTSRHVMFRNIACRDIAWRETFSRGHADVTRCEIAVPGLLHFATALAPRSATAPRRTPQRRAHRAGGTRLSVSLAMSSHQSATTPAMQPDRLV